MDKRSFGNTIATVAAVTSLVLACRQIRNLVFVLRAACHADGKDSTSIQKCLTDEEEALLATRVTQWWQRLNQESKPELQLPDIKQPCSEPPPAAYTAVANMVLERVHEGRDWLVRDSDYGAAPAHAGIKAKVNAALVSTMREVLGDLGAHLAADPRNVLLLLDTPQYGSVREMVSSFPCLRFCQQVVVPQADLRHYIEMLGSEFYVGVRAQRLDHWLCVNAGQFRVCAAFLDFECRLAGARSARLCPAADVMRFFRFGYPADVCVLALTVGLEDPAPTVEEVDAFVRWEAILNGYDAQLVDSWKYRMASLLYVVRRQKYPTAG